MSSGSLPLATYHRAQALGEGTYGSVMVVYNSDGEEFALKLFIDDDEDEDEDGDSKQSNSISLGTLREISVLRILRDENKHTNIIEMSDVKTPESDECEEYNGAGTSGYIGMAMPIYHGGNLADAIEKGLLKLSRQMKVKIAHGLLSAVAHLHDNGIIHRDIKADNIMISQDICSDHSQDKVDGIHPVLIDFSLAKFFDLSIYDTMQPSSEEACMKEMTHTGQVGTVTYRAPEIYLQQSYGLKSDLWSVGVILLEMITNHTLVATKDKEAVRMIQEMIDSLPNDQPFPDLIRGLLDVDPEKRLSAREALQSPLFQKFDLNVPSVRKINLESALPLDGSEDDTEGSVAEKKKMYLKRAKRKQNIERLCAYLGSKHPLTPQAAFAYCEAMYQLDDTLDDLKESQTMQDCVILANKFFETDLINLSELEEEGTGLFENWSFEEYLDNETTIWMIMDYCLYPRKLIAW